MLHAVAKISDDIKNAETANFLQEVYHYCSLSIVQLLLGSS